QDEIKAIEKYAVGAASFEGSPCINAETLAAKGFTAEEIAKLDSGLKSAFAINFVFNRFTLGDDCLRRLGFTEEQINDFGLNILEEIG
ncbi:hypothetical protein ABTL67_19600, partial [Acinetobacter baumannii]